MRVILVIFIFLMSQSIRSEGEIRNPIACPRKPTVIAVIDTGFGKGYEGEWDAKLCQYGHKDFSGYNGFNKGHVHTPVPLDHHGHGTHIAGLIDKYAKYGNENYCLVILKYFDPLAFHLDSNHNMTATVEAIKYATAIKADFINYSSGGDDTSKEEIDAVKKFIDQGGTFVAAAGNENNDLEKTPYFPALDDPRVIVVGNIQADGTKSQTSNYGNLIDRWENGNQVEVYGVKMTGTSQAAAITTGKLVSEIHNTCK